MADWMAVLKKHTADALEGNSQRKLLILFQCDQAVLDAQGNPFDGVLDVIRWFQIQPGTSVGLCSRQSQAARDIILRTLNGWGKDNRVQFSSELFYLGDTSQAVRHFRQEGYHVFAVIAGHKEEAKVSKEGDILFLDFDGQPSVAARYHLAGLIDERLLPPNVELVWHGTNDNGNFRQFLASNVQWAEGDIQTDPRSGELVLFHDSLAERYPEKAVNQPVIFDDFLAQSFKFGKSIKFDLKEGGDLDKRVLEQLKSYPFENERLWFNGYVDLLGEAGFRQFADLYPGSVIQCPVSDLIALITSDPEAVKKQMDTFASWGINRFSVDWKPAAARQFVNLMTEWGYEVNLYGMSDLESFLQAVVMLPRSVTADFNFPEWHYYGRGSGQGGVYYEYNLRQEKR